MLRKHWPVAIASKEARETHYWLRLLRDSKTVPDDRIVPLLDEAEQLVRIMTAIVKTSQSNSNLKPQNLKLKTQTREGNA
jgi:hypothetical protein